MWYQLKSYFFFFFKSTNQHGIHSPFVFDFITKCVYNTSNYYSYTILRSIRKRLFNNTDTIVITDFGEGSRVFKSNHRKISSIAKNAGIPFKRQKLLFRLVEYFKVEKALELGTSLGLATTAIYLANPSVKLDTVEGCPATSEKADALFSEFNLKNIQLHNMTFDHFFSSEKPSEVYDLIYIDGNHNKENTLEYFNIALNKVTNNSVIIFDDIYWSSAMNEAWLEICENEKVKISIDMFHWGLIFFRKEQQKQHFTIRM